MDVPTVSELDSAIKHFISLQQRYTSQHNGHMCELVGTALTAMKMQREVTIQEECIRNGALKYDPRDVIINPQCYTDETLLAAIDHLYQMAGISDAEVEERDRLFKKENRHGDM